MSCTPLSRIAFSTVALLLLLHIGSTVSAKPTHTQASLRLCVRGHLETGPRGFRFGISKSVKARLHGLRSLLRRASSRVFKRKGPLLAKLTRLTARLPDDLGFEAAVEALAKIGGQDLVKAAFGGRAKGWLGKAVARGRAKLRMRIARTGAFISRGYARAGITLQGLPVIQGQSSGTLVVFAGRTSPSTRPLLRVRASAALIYLGSRPFGVVSRRATFCRVLIPRGRHSLQFGWIKCRKQAPGGHLVPVQRGG
ncbi:MAG: hypothetical protein KAI47_20515 [Deltaproteobacteria bacterium]|nr:hypothetical protein [Deltaproteobacteria bacterium]